MRDICGDYIQRMNMSSIRYDTEGYMWGLYSEDEHEFYKGTIMRDILLMDEILHHLGALNYCNSWDFRDLRWCKISSINSMW